MSTVADTFLDFLVIALSKFEGNERSALNYDGPTDWRTEAVTRSLLEVWKRRASCTDLQVGQETPSAPSDEKTLGIDDEQVEDIMLPANANTFPAPKDSQQNLGAPALSKAQPEDADWIPWRN